MDAYRNLEDCYFTLVAYCEVFGLTVFIRGEGPMTDDEEWEGMLAAGYDPRYIGEMTPIVPIALSGEGQFQVITGQDRCGDVMEVFTQEQVVSAIRLGRRLHADEDDANERV